MTVSRNNMETGAADETTATSGITANGSPSAGTAWTVSVGGSPTVGTMKYDTAQFHSGSLSVRMNCVAGGFSRAEVALAGSSQCAISGYLRTAAYPSADLTIGAMQTAAAGSSALLQLSATGKLKLLNGGAGGRWTSVASVPLNAWWRCHLGIGVGVDITHGTLKAALWSGSDLELATPTEESTLTATENAGVNPITAMRLGKVGSGLAWDAWLDDLAWDDASALYIASPSGTAPTISFTIADARIIDASGITGTPTPTATLTQISGTAVTSISGPDAAGKFVVVLPAGLATSVVLRLTATNTAGAPHTDITITPPAAPATNTVTDFCTWNGSALVR